MARYLVQRVAESIITVAIGGVVAFAVFHMLPGDIAAVIAGPLGTPQQAAAIHHDLGLDQPLTTQFADYVWRLLHFDLGISYVSHVPVTTLFAERVPVTLELIVTSVVIAVIASLVLSLGALNPGSVLDRVAAAWSTLGLSIPVFWLGLLLALVFGVWLDVLPTSGFVSFLDDPLSAGRFSLLPSVTLGFYMSAILTQFLRGALLDVMQEDYIRTARAKGLPEWRVIVKHAAKPALIPFMTVLGILIGTAVGGTVIIEAEFNYPGFGRLFVDSILKRDYFVVQSGILLVVASVVVVNLITDVLYAFLDPRIRFGQSA